MSSYIPSFLRGTPESPVLPLTAQDLPHRQQSQEQPLEPRPPIASSSKTRRETIAASRPTLPLANTGSSRRSAGFRTALSPRSASGSGSDSDRSDPLPSPPTPISPSRRRAHTVSVVFAGRPRAGSTSRQNASGSGTERKASMPSMSEEERATAEGHSRLSGGVRLDRTLSPVSYDLAEADGRADGLPDEAVGVLDVVDPEVSTMNHLQNVTNGLMVPHFPQLWSRRPEIVIPETPSDDSLAPLTAATPGTAGMTPSTRRRATITRRRASTVSRLFPPTSAGYCIPPSSSPTVFPKSAPAALMPSAEEEVGEDEGRENEDEEGGAGEDDDLFDVVEHDDELDKHVRRALKASKRTKLKKVGKGLWAFVKTPMGFITAVYGFLVAFWGAGIVLFLLGWIPTSSKYRQDVWVERCSQIENGLFTLTGVGLIPWRVIDTYRMIIIWRLQHRTFTLRKAQGLPPIEDCNDLPDPKEAADYVSVLSDKEQAQLRHQQEAFAKSQTWYRPHATDTHRAFPITWALWNTLLMDGNSFFQCILCGCMWGMNWHERPAWTTGTLIPLSFLCGIGAGVLIWQGSVRTKKSAKVEDTLREALGVPLTATRSQKSTDDSVTLADLQPRGGLKTAPASLSGGDKGCTQRRKSSVSFVDRSRKGEGDRRKGTGETASHGPEANGNGNENGSETENENEKGSVTAREGVTSPREKGATPVEGESGTSESWSSAQDDEKEG